MAQNKYSHSKKKKYEKRTESDRSKTGPQQGKHYVLYHWVQQWSRLQWNLSSKGIRQSCPYCPPGWPLVCVGFSIYGFLQSTSHILVFPPSSRSVHCTYSFTFTALGTTHWGSPGGVPDTATAFLPDLSDLLKSGWKPLWLHHFCIWHPVDDAEVCSKIKL